MSRRTRKPKRTYKLRHFILDVFLSAITYGLWLIWIFVREMRRNR